MDISEITVAGFQLTHLLVSFLIIATFVFLLYWLWTWPCGKKPNITDDEGGVQPKEKSALLPTLTPLYAMEIEPGIVVLQSEDGEFFRILREYDSADRTGNGSKYSEHPSSETGSGYIPSYTRAHYQTRPSAPLYPHMDTRGRDDLFGDGARWEPINTVSSSLH